MASEEERADLNVAVSSSKSPAKLPSSPGLSVAVDGKGRYLAARFSHEQLKRRGFTTAHESLTLHGGSRGISDN